jgi:hypothetical protein
MRLVKMGVGKRGLEKWGLARFSIRKKVPVPVFRCL